ncbi:hypothetical protein [Rugamonas apoptosis]|uniref:hypothetical protein n=1 Tax=Rugamonas apoptosis TaxID=2758570 RepID=UPI001E4A053C|nr:hypothetical protein [Rugamonas apoptosis]
MFPAISSRAGARLARCLAVWLGVSLLSACAATTPDWDQRFGQAARATLAQQVLHPEAARNADPVAGMDGRAANAAHARYQKSFAEPKPQPASFTIGVSGGQ